MHALITRRTLALLPFASKRQVWKFDNLTRIGGTPVRVEGAPRLIDTPKGKAIEFNGDKDALFLDVHPLAGARQFTWQVIFRPDSGGRPEQRFFHLQEDGSAHRMLFETRLIGNQWCLDSFLASSAGSKPLLDRTLLHPLDEWHHVAMTYDGRTFRSFVNHSPELSAEVPFAPQGPGKTSAGVRINRVDPFKGAIRLASFVPKALSPREFIRW